MEANVGWREVCERCTGLGVPGNANEQLQKLVQENEGLKAQVEELELQLSDQKAQTKAYRDYIAQRTQKDHEMIGAAEATNWRKRLDEYIAQVSATTKAIDVFSWKLLAVLLLLSI